MCFHFVEVCVLFASPLSHWQWGVTVTGTVWISCPQFRCQTGGTVAQEHWAPQALGHWSLTRGKEICLQEEKGGVAGWKAVLQLCFRVLTFILGDVTVLMPVFFAVTLGFSVRYVWYIFRHLKPWLIWKKQTLNIFFVWVILCLSVMLPGWKHPAAWPWPLCPVWLWKCY